MNRMTEGNEMNLKLTKNFRMNLYEYMCDVRIKFKFVERA